MKVGMKIYSYCYGPMTVKSCDENYVIASVDNPQGFSKEFIPIAAGGDLKNIRFKTSDFGNWYFDAASNVMIKDAKYAHADFVKGGKTYPISKEIAETYPVEKDSLTYPKEKESVTYPVAK